ncbi:MDR family MFS transporter [Pseudomonas sp. NA-150]|uniref:MDR family MFS transporter n=1 Tax=Pseudomonas sp. NA-150 TaxID=3367525 RepID=UPI0037C733CE
MKDLNLRKTDMPSADSRSINAIPPATRGVISAVLWPLMLVLFISTLDQTIIATALGRISEELGDSVNTPWIVTAYLLTSAISTLIFGKLGDMYGRKKVFQVAVALFVAGSALCSLAPTMLWLIGFRALQGVGGGGLNSLVMAIIGDLVSPRERARYQATLGIVPAIAIILGPVLGGLIVDHWSWQWIFLINVPIGLLAFCMIAARLHLPARTSTHRLDIAGALLSILFTTSFLVVMVQGGNAFAWGSWQILGLAAVSLISLVTYLLFERSAAEPITPLVLFANPIFSVSSALFFLSTATLFVGMLFVPLMLQTVFGLSALVSGSSIVPLLLGLIVATTVTGVVISRTGRYRAFPILGALLAGAGLYMLGRVHLTTALWPIIFILTIIGIGLGFFIQVVVVAGQNAVEYRYLGVATGALNFFKTLGGATGAATFGAVLASGMAHATSPELILVAFHSVFQGATAMMGLALVLALLLKNKPLSPEMVAVAEGRVDVPEY